MAMRFHPYFWHFCAENRTLHCFGATPRWPPWRAEALTQAAAFDPHFVLLDIGLPEMDGYEVARRMKIVAPNARLIAITGYGLAGDRERSASSGFEAHLVKPVSLADIETAFAALTH